ncbi:MAG TPA: DUF4326 domain-containing protein [Candidatus Scalindua sp.]|nr:DUF4326 domain-containing protein [Candidatus Scalindua sp.]
MVTRVVNKRKEKGTKYIGRGSPFGNPYIIGPDGTRADVIRKHIEWLNEWIKNKKEIVIWGYSNKWVVDHLRELKGEILECFCDPLSCHGDYLAELVENLED